MGRPKKTGVMPNLSRNDSTGSSLQSSATQPSRSRPVTDEPASTLTLRFDAQGRPLPLTEKNRERLQEAVELLGVGASSTGPRVEVELQLDDASISRFFDVLSRLQALIISRTTRLAFDDLFRVLKLTDEERAALREPVRNVLRRRFGQWLAAHQDEAGLVVTLLVIQMRKFDELMKLKEKAESKGEQQ